MDRPPGDNILPQVRRYPLLSGADIESMGRLDVHAFISPGGGAG